MTATNQIVAAVVTPKINSPRFMIAPAPMQTHNVHHDKGIACFAVRIYEQICLDHRDTGRQADENIGAKTRRVAVLVAIEADHAGGGKR